MYIILELPQSQYYFPSMLVFKFPRIFRPVRTFRQKNSQFMIPPAFDDISYNSSKFPKNHVLQHIFINSLLVVKKSISVPFLKTSQLAKMFKISNKKVAIMFGGVV